MFEAAKLTLAKRFGLAMLCLVMAIGPMVPSPAATQGAPSTRHPTNIIVIVADDMGWADNTVFADMGGGRDVTPNLARLAQSGVRFPRAYVTASVCAPSRAGLMTGRYQNRFGYDHLPDGYDDKLKSLPPELAKKVGVDPHELTLGDVMQKNGYYTGLIGKWHLGALDPFYPTRRGFNEFYGFLGAATQYISSAAPGVHLAVGGPPHAAVRPARFAMMEGPNRTPVNNFDTYLTDDLTDKSVSFIDKHKDKPFFLYLGYNAVHAPFEVTDKYYQRFAGIKDENTRIKAAMTAALDDGVGRVLDELDRTGLRKDTLVVFVSDNGCAMFLPSAVCSCDPLRGGKLSQYEGGVRSPMIMSWPAKLGQGQTFDKVVSALDIFPTAVDAAGGKLPTDRVYDGVDLIPYLSGAVSKSPHETLYWERDPYEAVISDDWKLWRSKDGSVKFLFDVAHDTNEAHNLYDKRPDKVAQLTKLLDRWEAQMPPESFPSPATVKSTYCGVPLELPG
jgi:arylsulfatase A-like enzyme